jgi:exodeoxyribonuclease VII small subunit
MSKSAQASATEPAPNGQQVSFEDALKKLESIVEAMENEELPLEALLARFEEGAQLAQLCQSRLAEAELKIQQLEKSAAGHIVLKPLSLAEEPSASSSM